MTIIVTFKIKLFIYINVFSNIFNCYYFILILRICCFEKFQIFDSWMILDLDSSYLERYGEDVNKCIMDCYNNPIYKNCGNSKNVRKYV